MRGLCDSAYFDTEYFLNLGENGKIVFTGFLNSLLIFDEVCVNYISVCLSNFLNQSFFLFYVFDNTSNYIYIPDPSKNYLHLSVYYYFCLYKYLYM